MFGLARAIIYARWLGPEGVGILALLALAKSFAFRYGNLGFGSSFAYFVASKKISASHAQRIARFYSFIISLLSIIVLLTFWRCDISPWRDIRPELFYLSLLTIFLEFFNNFYQRVLSGELRFTIINLANIISDVSSILFLMILVIYFELGVMGAITSIILSRLTTFIYLIHIPTKEDREIFETAEIKKTSQTIPKGGIVVKLWSYGRWNYLAMFSAFFIEEVPLILLKSFLANNVAVGFFTKARELGRQSRVVVDPIAQVLFPFTAASKKDRAIIRTNIICRNGLFIMLLVVSIMMIFSKHIITFLYGEKFIPSVDIFYALAPAITLWPLARFLGTYVTASGKSKAIFYTSLITLSFAIPICWLLIPRYGAIGAGMSVSGIYTVRVFLRLIIYTKITRASILEIIWPNRTDLNYYYHFMKNIFIKYNKKLKLYKS